MPPGLVAEIAELHRKPIGVRDRSFTDEVRRRRKLTPKFRLPPSTAAHTIHLVQVTFRKLVEKRVTTWDAVRGKRTRVPGSTMALGRGGLPHDLIQMIVEGVAGLDRGFWGSVAVGATFNSMPVKRTTPGRAVIARNRHELDEAEKVVGEHYHRWKHGLPTPAAPYLDDIGRRWDALADGGQLVIAWPSLRVVLSP